MSEYKPRRDELLGIIAAPFLIWAIIHAIRSRTLEEFIRYSAYIAVPILIVVLIFILVVWVRDGFPLSPKDDWVVILLTPLIIAFYGTMFYAIGASLKDAYLWVRAPTSKGSLVVFGSMSAALVIGLVLFYFRLRLRSIYGFTEMLVGITVAAQRTSAAGEVERENVGFYLALLTAGVYLVVRGLDNIHQGLTKDPTDPLASILFNYLKAMWTGREKGQPEEQLQPTDR